MTKNELEKFSELVNELDRVVLEEINQELNMCNTSDIPRNDIVNVYTKDQLLASKELFENCELEASNAIDLLEWDCDLLYKVVPYYIHRVGSVESRKKIVAIYNDEYLDELLHKQGTIVYHYLNLWLDNHDELKYINQIPDNIIKYFFQCKMNELKRVTCQTLFELGGAGATDDWEQGRDDGIQIAIDELERIYQFDDTKWNYRAIDDDDDNRKDVL